jgi:predicted RNase H-like HicB family nuclease
MATTDAGDDLDEIRQEIRLLENPDGRWTSIHEPTGVASQGETRAEALEHLDEAVALYRGEIGHEPTDEEIRALGVDPADARDSSGDLPDVLK